MIWALRYPLGARIDNIRVQDIAVPEDQKGLSMSDRTTEHLGSSDLGVIATRRRLLEQARARAKGVEPLEPRNPRVYDIHSLAISADRGVDWEELMPAVHEPEGARAGATHT
jgi:hypothetical protein